MYLINEQGRVVDLPARMEKQGFKQAREVLSISQELMDGIPTGVLMTDYDTQKLKQDILSKFPNVVTDEEYLKEHPVKLPEKKPSEEPISKEEIERGLEPVKELVNEDMTKKEIIQTAKENGIILDSKDERMIKANLISAVNDNYKG